MSDLQERVRDLERFRYAMLGRANAYETLILDLWMQIIQKSDDPVALAKALRKAWLERVQAPGDFPGVDPSHLDVVADEHRVALGSILDRLVSMAGVAAAMSDRPRKE